MNALSDLGALIVTDRQAHVHVSGHPGRPELEAMYRWIRPQILVPVHGEIRHMREQARFGLSQGIPHAVVQRNGDLIRLAPDGPEKIGEERVGRLVLDGDVILPADGSTINERRKISVSGLITVACPSTARGRWPARQWSVPSACRSSKIATISWPTRPMPPSALIDRRAISTRFVKRCGWRSAAVPRCGPARSRWSR